MSGWVFDQGIVSVKPVNYTQLVRRFYYVKYAKGDLRRLIMTIYIYGVDSDENSKSIIDWATDEKIEEKPIFKILPKNLISFNKVVSIMDFNIHEKDQHPQSFKELESEFQVLDKDLEDEENPLSLKHFEKYLSTANYEKCICTLTNDEESRKRISDIVPLRIPVQNPLDFEQPPPSP